MAAAVAVVAPVGFAWWVSGQIVRPPWYELRTPEEGLRPGRLTDPSTDFGLAFEDVAFPAIDGSTMRGWLVPATPGGDTVVIGVHGGGSACRSFTTQRYGACRA